MLSLGENATINYLYAIKVLQTFLSMPLQVSSTLILSVDEHAVGVLVTLKRGVFTLHSRTLSYGLVEAVITCKPKLFFFPMRI